MIHESLVSTLYVFAQAETSRLRNKNKKKRNCRVRYFINNAMIYYIFSTEKTNNTRLAAYHIVVSFEN